MLDYNSFTDTSLKSEQHQLVALTGAVVRHEMYIGSLEREKEWCFLVLYLLCTGWVGFFDCHSHTKYWFFLFFGRWVCIYLYRQHSFGVIGIGRVLFRMPGPHLCMLFYGANVNSSVHKTRIKIVGHVYSSYSYRCILPYKPVLISRWHQLSFSVSQGTRFCSPINPVKRPVTKSLT